MSAPSGALSKSAHKSPQGKPFEVRLVSAPYGTQRASALGGAQCPCIVVGAAPLAPYSPLTAPTRDARHGAPRSPPFALCACSKVVRKSIARVLTVQNQNQKREMRVYYKDKQLPLDLRTKKTRTPPPLQPAARA